MFIGQSTAHVDLQGYLSLPRQHTPAAGGKAYVTFGFDSNLLYFSEGAFQHILERVGLLSITDPLARAFVRLLLGNAAEVTPGAEQRICLPEALRRFAGIEQELVIVGQGEYCEFWSPSLWEQQGQLLLDNPANAGRFSGLQITLLPES